MSEQAPAPIEAEQENTEQSAPGDQGRPLGPNGEKALKAEREARAAAEKAAAEFKARLDEIEAANLTELEKSQRAAKEAQDQLATLTRQTTIQKVALEKGVPADLVAFLNGDTEEVVAAQADTLLARLNAPHSPLPDTSQGAKGDPASGTPANDFAQFLTNQLGR